MLGKSSLASSGKHVEPRELIPTQGLIVKLYSELLDCISPEDEKEEQLMK